MPQLIESTASIANTSDKACRSGSNHLSWRTLNFSTDSQVDIPGRAISCVVEWGDTNQDERICARGERHLFKIELTIQTVCSTVILTKMVKTKIVCPWKMTRRSKQWRRQVRAMRIYIYVVSRCIYTCIGSIYIDIYLYLYDRWSRRGGPGNRISIVVVDQTSWANGLHGTTMPIQARTCRVVVVKETNVVSRWRLIMRLSSQRCRRNHLRRRCSIITAKVGPCVRAETPLLLLSTHNDECIIELSKMNMQRRRIEGGGIMR